MFFFNGHQVDHALLPLELMTAIVSTWVDWGAQKWSAALHGQPSSHATHAISPLTPGGGTHDSQHLARVSPIPSLRGIYRTAARACVPAKSTKRGRASGHGIKERQRKKMEIWGG